LSCSFSKLSLKTYEDEQGSVKLGLVPADVKAVLPEVVSQETQWEAEEEVEEEGVGLMQLLYRTVGVVQDMQAKITALEKANAAMARQLELKTEESEEPDAVVEQLAESLKGLLQP